MPGPSEGPVNAIRPSRPTLAWAAVAIKHLFVYVLASERVFAHTGAMSRTDVRRRQRSLRRRRRLARTLVVATTVSSGLAVLAGHATAGASRPAPHPVRVYVVQAGDTLWGIATRVAGPGADPRPVVDRLIAANGLAGPDVAPGMVLRLPVSY
jgi:nucleoid-associated protein YgaU